MRYFILLGRNEFIIIVFLAVHLEHNVNIVSCDQKLFSVILSYSLFNSSAGDNNLFVVCLVIPSVCSCFDGKCLFVKGFHVDFGGVFVKCKPNHLIISRIQ